MRRFVLSIAAFAALLLAGVTAVQGQSSPSGSSTPTACASPMASPASSPMAAMTTAATATEAMGSPAAGTPSAANCGGGPTVEMVDINFQPKEITIPANTDVTITLKNDGSTVHSFNIDALNIHSGDYQPGQTGTVKVNAKPGDYTYYCNIPGHEAAGMVGTLHVK